MVAHKAAKIECSLAATALDAMALRGSLPALPECGGYASFEGLVRNINDGKDVVQLEYEAYEELATKELRRIAEQAAERFGLGFVRCVHRTGALAIGEPAVIIQVLSKHRREAFEGCRFMIDQLKVRVPIWKRERYVDGSCNWTKCQHEHGVRDAHESFAGD